MFKHYYCSFKHSMNTCGKIVVVSTKLDRHARILSELQERERLETASFAQALGVSEMTLRRDLDELAAEGALVRTHGGAQRGPRRTMEPPFRLRAQEASESKLAIAREAAALVGDGESVGLDVGTTGITIVEHWAPRTDLTLVTSNLRTAWAASEVLDLQRSRLIVVGGVVRADELSMAGTTALATLDSLRVDTAIVSVAGVHHATGATDYNLDDAAVKKKITDGATRVIALADGRKIGAQTFARICPANTIDVLITDPDADEAELQRLADAGVGRIIIADPTDAR